ncbi:UPF0262 family protein [Mesorhizobium sp. M4A.F.Ca.ET.050.02.1.1]|uniref:UPF0262 family protein n=1 Tax=Mesorhizobium sp. M4A.F.Ca.ET.050.02.1.1 TaxID=2496754 RepID=UPI00167D4262|nr:UPF0262 family protein [Mesorhizobium sp. M4A.F.Ca.ET.050.02.1.1]
MDAAEFFCDVSLDPSTVNHDGRVERERAIAVQDLVENSKCVPRIRPSRTVSSENHIGGFKPSIIQISTDTGAHVGSQSISLGSFRRIIRDYTRICESYFDAVRHPGPDRLEAIEMSRRSIHNDAAALLKERLASVAGIDLDAARHLFSLIHVLLSRTMQWQLCPKSAGGSGTQSTII